MEYSRFGIFRTWDVWDVGCSVCGVFGMECSGFEMLGMWDVRDVIYWDVRCWGCGKFGI